MTGNPCRRPIEWLRTLYRCDDLSGPLPLGVLESLALPFESYKLAFTPSLVTQVYEGRLTDAMLVNHGGYVHSQGEATSWVPSGQIFYSPNRTDDAAAEAAYARQHFFLPHRFRDTFDNENIIRYDEQYELLMVSSRDPAGNEVTAKNDYRVLQPCLVTDPNGNRAGIAFDTLGIRARIPIPFTRSSSWFRSTASSSAPSGRASTRSACHRGAGIPAPHGCGRIFTEQLSGAVTDRNHPL